VVIEEARDIDLAPGQHFDFEVDAGGKWPELLPPGRHALQIIDELWEPSPRSSEATVEVVYDEGAPPRLLGLLRDDQRSPETRQFAAAWLDALHGDFALRQAAVTASPTLTAALQRYQAWWQQHHADAAVRAQLAKLAGAKQ
jgi:hypothetical protein